MSNPVENLPDRDEVFNYLDFIRGTGIVNMFGAGPLLEGEFGYSRAEAKRYLLAWMRSYDATPRSYEHAN